MDIQDVMSYFTPIGVCSQLIYEMDAYRGRFAMNFVVFFAFRAPLYCQELLEGYNTKERSSEFAQNEY